MRQNLALLLALFASAAAGLPACAGAPPRPPPALELVESAPLESGLDHPDLPDTHEVWRKMFAGAKRTIDVAQFYVSDAPGSRMGPVLHALVAATVRGVRVRLLVDASFAKKYPEPLSELEDLPGLEVRRLDFGEGGGAMHAKYFVVDGKEAFVGSANFDWRALTHVHELGLRVRLPRLASALAELFESDWRRAGGEATTGKARPGPRPASASGVIPALSARKTLPDADLWDLPKIVGAIDGARRRVRVQVLKYDPRRGDGSPFPDLDAALRRAASRGVRVELLVSNWSTHPDALAALRGLARTPNVSVKLVSIPRFSGGFIPYARTIHAKYMTVDGERAWLGSSNWEGDYFLRGRNAGLLVDGTAGGAEAKVVADIERVFEHVWTSRHARPFDPSAAYAPPTLEAP